MLHDEVAQRPRRRRDHAAAATTFYIRRFFRIAPLYYVWIVIMSVRGRIGSGAFPRPAGYIPNLTFTFNLIPGHQEGLVWASWTLGVEMLFYLLFPLIFLFTTSAFRALLFVAVSFVAAAIYDLLLKRYLPSSFDLAKVTHVGLPHQLPIFAIGILVFYFDDFVRKLAGSKTSFGAASLVIAAIGFVTVPTLVPGKNFPAANLYLMGLDYGVLVLGLSVMPIKAIVNSATVFLGKISYSTYLNHPLTVLFLARWLFPRIYPGDQPSLLRLLGCFASVFGVLLPISYFTYRFVERPGINLGGRIVRKRLGSRKSESEPEASATSAATAPPV